MKACWELTVTVRRIGAIMYLSGAESKASVALIINKKRNLISLNECEIRICGRDVSGSAYTRIPHHQQTIPLRSIGTPQVSLHNITSTR